MRRAAVGRRLSVKGESNHQIRSQASLIRAQREGSFHHAVAFYDNDDALAEQVAKFLDMSRPGTAIVVATRAHRATFERHLTTRVPRYISLDAETLLPDLLVDNFPDEGRLRAAVGGLLETAGEGPIRIFGEMVALLWERGDVAAALKLEKLWNGLAEDYRFSLFCAYPASLFQGSASLESYLRMCGTHSHLVPFKG